MNHHDFDIAMTYGARGTMAMALEQLGHARQAERRDADAVTAGTFTHLMSVLEQAPAAGAAPEPRVDPPAASSGPAASATTAWLQTPMTGVVTGVLNTILAARDAD